MGGAATTVAFAQYVYELKLIKYKLTKLQGISPDTPMSINYYFYQYKYEMSPYVPFGTFSKIDI